MCLEIYELDPTCFLTAPGLARAAALKQTKVKLYLLTDVNVLLMVEKCIRIGICHAIYSYVKAKHMKNCDKIKNHHILSIGT